MRQRVLGGAWLVGYGPPRPEGPHMQFVDDKILQADIPQSRRRWRIGEKCFLGQPVPLGPELIEELPCHLVRIDDDGATDRSIQFLYTTEIGAVGKSVAGPDLAARVDVTAVSLTSIVLCDPEHVGRVAEQVIPCQLRVRGVGNPNAVRLLGHAEWPPVG